MSKDAYEVRGLKFFARSNAMAMDRLCTFSISLRVPSGSYWVAYYKWQENITASADLSASGSLKVIATGADALPGLLYLDGGMFPKDVLDYEGGATLDYIRERYNQFVWVRITATGQKQQTLHFRMVEPTAPSANEHYSMKGRIGLWKQGPKGKDFQTLQHSPNAAPPQPFFRPQ